jgi:hypothetical protein
MYRSPMDQAYHPEEDQSALLNPRQSSVYRGLIGSANWIITLGRFDIPYTVNTMSRFSMAPREGHFEALLRLFGYLKQYPKVRILVNRNPRYKTQPTFMKYDWNEFIWTRPKNYLRICHRRKVPRCTRYAMSMRTMHMTRSLAGQSPAYFCSSTVCPSNGIRNGRKRSKLVAMGPNSSRRESQSNLS